MLPTPVTDGELAGQGQALFQSTCAGCHGRRAEGLETMPRLAGQSADYIRRALTRFRDNDPSRAGSVMRTIAGQLSEAEIQALAAYLQGLSW